MEIETRSWFNPNLITRWFIVPGLIAVLALINSILSGALSIAREREEGTFDQLLVAPYNPGEILLGKGIATVITGSMQAVFVVLVAMFWFRIPFQGSIWLLATAILLFIITATAIGLCISSFAQSLQQAIVGTFLLLVPMVMLSGLRHPHLQHAGHLPGPYPAQPHAVRPGTHPAHLPGRGRIPGPLAALRGHSDRNGGIRIRCHLLLPSQNLLTGTQAIPAAHP